MIKTVGKALLDQLAEQARSSERLRAHHTLHTEMSDPIHRFCVAAEPGTVVTPHRHPGKWELVVMLRGEIEVETFDETGKQLASYVLTPEGDLSALELPETVFHRFLARRSSAFLEIKPGPYTPPENAPWL